MNNRSSGSVEMHQYFTSMVNNWNKTFPSDFHVEINSLYESSDATRIKFGSNNDGDSFIELYGLNDFIMSAKIEGDGSYIIHLRNHFAEECVREFFQTINSERDKLSATFGEFIHNRLYPVEMIMQSSRNTMDTIQAAKHTLVVFG